MHIEKGGNISMTEEKRLQRMIEKDLEEYERVWKQFSYDTDEMDALFRMLISHYIDKINGFAEDIEVICDYEKAGEKIEIYQKNIALLIERMKLFAQNGYKNEGLLELYLKQEKERDSIAVEMDFTAVRLHIGMLQDISEMEREEIIQNLGEIEEICSLPLKRKKKWDRLRKYIVWISGKDVKIAMKLLPLFLKII